MRITLIGAGNLATRLGIALKAQGHVFEQIYSRTYESASALATLLDGEATINAEKIRPNSDLYICALKDDALPQILPLLHLGDGILVHTAGSLNLDILFPFTDKAGVFYLLQTFNKNKDVDFKAIPIYIESNESTVRKTLFDLAESLSKNVQVVDSEKRLGLHVSAVFACNFVNYMYTISSDLMVEHGLDFMDLIPLITETAEKLKVVSPAEAQTGPAVRMDHTVIDKHLSYLQNHPELKSIYEELSQAIHQRQTQKIDF